MQSSPPSSPSALASRRSGSLSPTAQRRRNSKSNTHYNHSSSNNHSNIPPGFLPFPKPHPKTHAAKIKDKDKEPQMISEMSIVDLQELYKRNEKILGSTQTNSTRYTERLKAEQAAIQTQLVEVHGMEVINTGMRNARIDDDDDAHGDVDMASDEIESPMSKAIGAKQRALAKFGTSAGPSHIGVLGLNEAIEIERRAHAHDLERKQRIEEKRQRQGYIGQDEVMSRKEREARIWAFMNYKPTESDLEDEDDDEDDDPAGWFEDDQDDGRKGQDIIEPDEEDSSLSNIIRVVEPSQMHYSTFYEPRDDGD